MVVVVMTIFIQQVVCSPTSEQELRIDIDRQLCVIYLGDECLSSFEKNSNKRNLPETPC